MKKHANFLSACAVLLLLALCCIPTYALETSKREVSSFAEFENALKEPTVHHIVMTKGFTESPRPAGDYALFIPPRDDASSLIIEGAGPDVTLNLQHAGIILLGDTTFKNMTFYFENAVRNVIVANGHQLTLENTNVTSDNTLSLFAGGITDYSSSNAPQLPIPSGTHGEIILKGKVNVANIFAGSMSDVANHDLSGTRLPDIPNNFPHPVTITQSAGSSGKIGPIYACGARENRSGGFKNDWFIDPTLYPVSGEVTIHLNGSAVRTIQGGNKNNVSVYYNDPKGLNLNQNATFSDLKLLQVNSGYLKPTPRSSFASAGVANGAILDFSALTEESVSLEHFSGGGSIALGQRQKLVIGASVTGNTTNVGIGEVSGWLRDASAMPVAENFPYVTAGSGSAENAFFLLPYQNGDERFTMAQRDGQCIWSFEKAVPKKVLIETIQMPETITVPEGAVEIQIPIDVTYAPSSTGDMNYVPLSIGVGGYYLALSGDSVSGYSYEGNLGYYPYTVFCGYGENGGEVLILQPDQAFFYGTVDVTIQQNYMASQKSATFKITFEKGPAEPEHPADITSVQDFTVNGSKNPAVLPQEALSVSMNVLLAQEQQMPQSILLSAYTAAGQLRQVAVWQVDSSLSAPLSLSTAFTNSKRDIASFRLFFMDTKTHVPLSEALDPLAQV